MSASITIAGVGVVSPLGDSPGRFRDALLAGATGIAPDQEFIASGCRSRLSARVAGFDAAAWISPMKLRRMDKTGPYALVALRQAMDAARYEVRPGGDSRTGVVLGTYSAGGTATSEYLEALFKGGPMGAPALLFNSTVGNAAAGLAGLEYQLCGPNATVSQKEASGVSAVASAVDLLRLDRADAIAAGGVDAIFSLFYRAHDQFRVMSDAAEAGAATAPWSATRRGFVMGEGGYALWLERGDAWRARGATAGAEILGAALSSDTCAVNAWPEHPEALARTMQLALDDAGVRAAEVDVVYASANGSVGLDATEARALGLLFARGRTVVTSIKGAIGECGAAGVAACAAAVLCGAVGRVPPIAGLAVPDATTVGLTLATVPMDAPGPVVLINGVGSGGALGAVVLRVVG